MNILPPTYDYVFKNIMSDSFLLQDLYVSLTKEPISPEDIIELNPNLLSEYKKDKTSELDLKFRIDDYAIINIEMQRENYIELWNRFQYYNGKGYTNQLISGDDYRKLLKVITIVFFEHKFVKEDNRPVHHYLLSDSTTNSPYINSNQLIFLEISKRKNCKDEQIKKWLDFFAAKKEEEFMELAQKYDVIDRAYKRTYQISADDDERARAEAIEKARLDTLNLIRSKVEESRNNTWNQAWNQGAESTCLTIAKKMLNSNASIDYIKEITGLSEEQIISLK